MYNIYVNDVLFCKEVNFALAKLKAVKLMSEDKSRRKLYVRGGVDNNDNEKEYCLLRQNKKGIYIASEGEFL